MNSVYKILTQSSAAIITQENNYQIVKLHTPRKVLTEKEIRYIANVIRTAKSYIFTKEYIADQDVPAIINSSDSIVAVFRETKFLAAGFATVNRALDVTFLFSAFVRKTYQKRGIGKLLMKAAIETTHFVFLTQTPHSYRLLETLTHNQKLYPNMDTMSIPPTILAKLQPIIATLPGRYCVETSTVLLNSGYSSFPKMPQSRNKKLNTWMYEKLYKDRKQGEEQLFFCLGERS